MLREFVRAASVQDLPPGSMRGVSVGGEDVLLARIGDEYFALDSWCTHAAGLLHLGRLHPGRCAVECPLHEGAFDLRTGEPTAPPAEAPATTFAVRIEGDAVYVGPKGSG